MRQTATITITDDGRDKDKTFFLEEMSALRAERWAMRAFLALARSKVEIPEDVAKLGLAGVAQLGLNALSGIYFEEAQPLLDELMTCVKIIRDPSRPDMKFDLLETDIEEVATSLRLKAEVFSLHTSFLSPAVRSKLMSLTTSPAG